ncbi:Ca-activated chloride channel family protein [Devosia enhydra]|uniref:Ca-activated chloride channel family protein n=1 Tax=Devosia enhydra TaxID=665118 RepID=A0A1K2HUR0_9HYPH|nr:hypothetical protein [Devosia enhydra]SFZ82279.1 Ca-activated chloride channel family protein [Devosia enhydra]
MIRRATALVAALAVATPALSAEIDETIAAFIGAPGFVVADAADANDTLAGQWTRTDLIAPGGNVGPVEQAILLAGADAALDHTRTSIAYGEVLVEEDGAPARYSFVELRRYNLGPALHAALVDQLGAENVAELSEFGEGPHRAWRLVFFPVMGSVAALLDVSARDIGDDEAASDECGGRPCLDPDATLDARAEWSEADAVLADWTPNFLDRVDGVATEAQAIAELEIAQYLATSDGGDYLWTGGEHPEAVGDATPFRFYEIDRNLGQELVVDALSVNTELNDDSIRDMLVRRIDVAGEVYWLNAAIPR